MRCEKGLTWRLRGPGPRLRTRKNSTNMPSFKGGLAPSSRPRGASNAAKDLTLQRKGRKASQKGGKAPEETTVETEHGETFSTFSFDLPRRSNDGHGRKASGLAGDLATDGVAE